MCFIGCDSGFGHELAKRLDTLGVTVFAGCLFPEDAGANELKLACSNRLHVLHLDVTMGEHVQNAVQYVKSSLGNKSKYKFEVKQIKSPYGKYKMNNNILFKSQLKCDFHRMYR
jgi:NAD(P)-dependent dehydrogenase (short-subunit alcohol dehydrogenase family)